MLLNDRCDKAGRIPFEALAISCGKGLAGSLESSAAGVGLGADCSDIRSSLVPSEGAGFCGGSTAQECSDRASFTSDAFRRSFPRSTGRNPAGGRA